MQNESANQLCNKALAELNEYVADVNLAHQSILGGSLARAKDLLARHRSEGEKRFENPLGVGPREVVTSNQVAKFQGLKRSVRRSF
jgi:hypothetical protein